MKIKLNSQLVLHKWKGRFCNAIVAITNAIHLAEQSKSHLKIIPRHPLLKIRNFDFSNGAVLQEKVTGWFYALSFEGIEAELPDWKTRRILLHKYIRPMLPMSFFPEESGEELVIHIRSGDVFQKKKFLTVLKEANSIWDGLKKIFSGNFRVHVNYVQPPLSYYTQIIESQAWSKIVIIAEDTGNPVILELLKKYKKIEFQLQDLESDIKTMLGAKNLVIGYGTFGVTWALLSSHLEALYCPLNPEYIFGALEEGDISHFETHTYEFQNYIPIGEWRSTKKQNQFMLEYKVENIKKSNSKSCPNT